MEMLRRRIGNFYLVSHLGAGGMAQVYLGVNPSTGEKRAVKVLSRRATGMAAAYVRFRREIDIIRGLCHPHIVRVLDTGALDDCYYYMMEYMPGGTLARRLSRGRLPLGESIDLFSQVCDAMAHAHIRGIIHRDLKPANILLDSAGHARVSDFGIAKALDDGASSLTQSDEIMGTVAYLAPEQRFNTKRVDQRADVYALGAILYEMIMGFPPLGKFPWPRETQPSFPAGLQAVLERSLAITPDDRYSHAGLLLSDIQQTGSAPDVPQGDLSMQPAAAALLEAEAKQVYQANSDRIEGWLQTLRHGTTRERLAVVREMVLQMEPREAKAILKLFEGEEDRVRWGLIRVLGDLKVEAATPMILNELKNPYHRECAIEALGKIGSDEAFNSIQEFLRENPESANITLLPLARTGKTKAINSLRPFLSHELAVIRQSAVRALAAIESPTCIPILRAHLAVERDEKVRAAVVQGMRTLETALRSKDTMIVTTPA